MHSMYHHLMPLNEVPQRVETVLDNPESQTKAYKARPLRMTKVSAVPVVDVRVIEARTKNV